MELYYSTQATTSTSSAFPVTIPSSTTTSSPISHGPSVLTLTSRSPEITVTVPLALTAETIGQFLFKIHDRYGFVCLEKSKKW